MYSKIRTCWILSYFWITLSTILASLSTFGFVQVEWLIKKETFIVTQFRIQNLNISISSYHDHHPSYFDSDNFLQYHGGGKGGKQSNNDVRIIKKTKKSVNTFKMGSIGYCIDEYYYPFFRIKESSCFLHRAHSSGGNLLVPVIITILGAVGCSTLCLCSILSILSVSLPNSQLRRRAACLIGKAQLVAVVFLFLCVLAFPATFGSEVTKHYCGESSRPFRMGDCQIGWAYALLIVSSSLAVYCPILVNFTWMDVPKCQSKI